MSEVNEGPVEAWFEKHNLVLDLAGLSEEQRSEHSMFVGGSGAKHVNWDDKFNHDEVNMVIFNWGDIKAEEVFSILLEHDDRPNENYFSFSATTVIGDQIWMLSLQEKDWQPIKAYQDESQYFILSYIKEEATKQLIEYSSLMTPRPELIGKVGSRWVAFELGQDMFSSETKAEETPLESENKLLEKEAKYTYKKALAVAERLVANLDFNESPEEPINFLTLNICHWILETFGRESSDGIYSIMSSSDGFSGKMLPTDVKHLSAYDFLDEIHYGKENVIKMKSQPEYFENDPYIKDWDEVNKLPTYTEQLDYIRNRPDIMESLKVGEVKAMPQVRITLEPTAYGTPDWGLVLIVNQVGIRLSVFGKENETWQASQYLVERSNKNNTLAEVACRLAILCANLTEYKRTDKIPASEVDLLEQRLYGKSTIPMSGAEFRPNPANAVKNLLIRTLLQED